MTFHQGLYEKSLPIMYHAILAEIHLPAFTVHSLQDITSRPNVLYVLYVHIWATHVLQFFDLVTRLIK